MPPRRSRVRLEFRFSHPGWVGFFAGTSVFLITCLSGTVLYLRSASALRDEVQSNLKSEAITLSALLDGDAHAQWRTPAQESETPYKNAIAPLYDVLRARKDIKFIYTCVIKNNKVFFVLDPTPAGDWDHDGLDDKSHIGQPYPDASPEMRLALQTGTVQVDAQPYKDAWGTFLSGYAPLRNKQGRAVAVVGVDMAASEYLLRLKAVQIAALMGMAVGLVVSLGVGLVVRRLFAGIQNARALLEARVRERTDELAKANAVLQEEIVKRERTVEALRTSEAHLVHQAFHDPLTGLPNRALFVDRLQRAVTQSAWRDRAVAVVFLDLNEFKFINDSLGHKAGDQFLIEVARRLQACVRPGDTVARLGGDEFTVLLDDLHDLSEAIVVTECITSQFCLPLLLESREVFTSASLGVAISQTGNQRETQDSDRLLREADTAMYQAKRNHGGGATRYVVFDGTMNNEAKERMELEADLRRALQNNEFRVFYQPVVRLDNGNLVEIEALVRWLHPTYGLIAPGRFVPIAEETGMIVPLGRWVLETACKQVKRWHEPFPHDPPLVVCVNLSGRQLQEPDVVEMAASVLRQNHFPPSCLKLELTESVMMVDAETTIAKLYALKALGVGLAVDDFGTGYSSMAYLSHFPLDTLKIDRSFVARLGVRNHENEAIVRAIVTLAKSLNLCVTGEGVETEAQREHLRDLGCDYAQGYLFAHPLTPEAMEGFLTRLQKERVAASAASTGGAQLWVLPAAVQRIGTASET